MKGLIWKDIYIVGYKNLKVYLLVMAIWAVAFIPNIGLPGYIAATSIYSCVFGVNTFTYDDACKWNRYAVVMPLSRKEIVRARYLSLLILSFAGVVIGTISGLVIGLAIGKVTLNAELIKEILLSAGVSATLVMFLCGILLLMSYKFGVERARLLMIAVMVCFAGGIYEASSLLLHAGVNTKALDVLGYLAPIGALLWLAAMYKVSCNIFMKKDL